MIMCAVFSVYYYSMSIVLRFSDLRFQGNFDLIWIAALEHKRHMLQSRNLE